MKGISEIIATVLILGVLIGIGTFVIRFSTQYTKESVKGIESPSFVDPFASLDINSVSSSNIFIENTGQRILKNFRVYVDETKWNISSAPDELKLSQPAVITLSNPISPGTHRIYVVTDKSTTKGTFEVSSSKMDITSFTGGTGYNVNTTSGLKLSYQ